MHLSLDRSARSAPALLVILLGLDLTGCSTLLDRSGSDRSFDEYRQYMAERTAAELAEDADEEEPTFEEKLAAAQRFHRSGETSQALRLYFDAFRLDPGDTRSHEGIAYLQLPHQPERAEAVFLGVIETDPNSTMAHVGVGLAKLAQDDPAGAVPYLERSVELSPNSADAHDSLAVALQELERFHEARVHAQRARDLAPDDADVANNLGISHLLLGDAVLAEAAFREAIALNSLDPTYRNNLGVSLGRQNRYEEALKAFRSAGSEQAAENNIAYIYFLNGRLDDAITHYERALQAEGDEELMVLRNLNAALDARDAQE
jgi:Flp pilus assembly protein TadD